MRDDDDRKFQRHTRVLNESLYKYMGHINLTDYSIHCTRKMLSVTSKFRFASHSHTTQCVRVFRRTTLYKYK